MNSVLAREGYTAILDALLGGLVSTARLYVNDPPLTSATVAADFVQPSFAGYSGQAVERWTPAAIRGQFAFSVAMAIAWTYTTGPAPAPIRGYYVVETASGRLLWAWRRPGDPLVLDADNRILTVYVKASFPLVCP